jgi:hypothetical protein
MLEASWLLLPIISITHFHVQGRRFIATGLMPKCRSNKCDVLAYPRD